MAELANQCLATGEAVALVQISETFGSTPRESGAQMLVTKDQQAGTIGGGQLEWLVLDKARGMLAAGEARCVLNVPLGPEINQCCGGRVTLELALLSTRGLSEFGSNNQTEQRPQVLIFGAGHTGKALARALEPLPLNVCLIDTRADILDAFETGVRKVLTPLPEAEIRKAPPGSAIVVMTHSHDLDFLVVAESLKRGDVAYCGMIGSATKRAVFSNWLENNGHEKALAQKLVCPIGGLQVRDKRPEVIAALTAAEILVALHAFVQPGIVQPV